MKHLKIKAKIYLYNVKILENNSSITLTKLLKERYQCMYICQMIFK